jgi:hypothetical protein
VYRATPQPRHAVESLLGGVRPILQLSGRSCTSGWADHVADRNGSPSRYGRRQQVISSWGAIRNSRQRPSGGDQLLHFKSFMKFCRERIAVGSPWLLPARFRPLSASGAPIRLRQRAEHHRALPNVNERKRNGVPMKSPCKQRRLFSFGSRHNGRSGATAASTSPSQ